MSTVPPGFETWIGRARESEDVACERLAASFRAILAPHLAEMPEGICPLGLHWCLCPEIAGMAELAADGHPAKNLFLPPVPLPRRMWAGGVVEISGDIRTGERVQRLSTIRDITRKQGRSGELWFVSIGHVYTTGRGCAVRERQDLVYREAAAPGGPVAKTAAPQAPLVPHTSTMASEIETTPALLFRYSAVTFNGHRIHYDEPYAREVEGYPGLVVHGPMQATLLLNLAARRLGARRLRLEYRGVAPAIVGSRLRICAGAGDELWSEGPAGQIHMVAKATALPPA